MEHFFNLPVEYNGEQIELSTRLVTFAYSFKFYVRMDHQEMVFEKDDEGNYRMLTADNNITADHQLVTAIIHALVELQNRQDE